MLDIEKYITLQDMIRLNYEMEFKTFLICCLKEYSKKDLESFN